ncbi:MAG: NAD(+)/NADH kinase [Alphaproteobacteria bacterium]|nr:NAD(+)/NADH kinase [Alphaproteobacteria bacterium]
MKLGFVVNPLAGSGGPLAAGGSDGLPLALAGGWAAARAGRALAGLAGADVMLFTAAGAMGAAVAKAANVPATVVHVPARATSAADTVALVAAAVAAGAEIILFAGGDGTARDVLAARPPIPVLGIPAGVKMHSGVFAPSPAAAAASLARLLAGAPRRLAQAEVVDRDGEGRLCLYGQLPVLADLPRQAAKAGGVSADALLPGAIAEAATRLRAEPVCMIGPGLTMLALKQALAGAGSLLGVDVFAHGRLVAADADAATVLALAGDAAPLLVLGVIGGQGFLLGRGNRQLAPALLARAQWPPLVIASAAKLAALPGGALWIDSGDEALDAALAGHIEVRTGRRRAMMMRLHAA